MTADLYPTPTRLRLLDQIANSQVATDITEDGDVIWLWPDAPTSWQDRVKVTARVRELETAGWAEQSHGMWWIPTDTGYAVLRKSRETTR